MLRTIASICLLALALPAFSQSISNDNCLTATVPPFDFNGDSDTTILGTLTGASHSGEAGCPYWEMADDAFYAVPIPASGIMEVKKISSQLGLTMMTAFRGSCGSLTQLFICGDMDAFGGLHYIPGETIYIRVWDGDTSLASGKDFELAFQDPSGCLDASTPPQNPDAVVFSHAVNLTWDKVPESIACQISGQFTDGSGPEKRLTLTQFERSNHFFTYDDAFGTKSGGFAWRVRCACSLPPNPTLLTGWSSMDTINIPNHRLADMPPESVFHPNPASKSIRFAATPASTVEILNISGQVVHRDEAPQSMVQLDHLNPGIYFLRLGDAVHPLYIQR